MIPQAPSTRGGGPVADDDPREIVLAGETPAARLRARDVYFPFASGRFAYDCVSCGATCCRGHGYLLQPGRELDTQLSLAPAVRFFLSSCEQGAPHFHVTNAAPACFFLDDDNKCRVQAAAGFAAKPATSRMFPFNSIVRLGEYLLVAPHPMLCPLTILPSGTTTAQSSHEALIEELIARGVNNHVQVVSYRNGDPAAAIRRERRIVALSEEYLDTGDYPAFAAVQLALAASAERRGGDEARRRECEADLRATVDLMHRVLGAQGPLATVPGDAVVRTLVAMTPLLRMEHVLAIKDAGGGLGAERMPYVLTALATFARLAIDAGMSRLSYQGVQSIMRENLTLLLLLSMVNRRVAWKSDGDVDVAFHGDPVSQQTYRTLAKLLLADPRGRGPTLGELLLDNVPHAGVERVVFLRQLARRTAGRLTTREDDGQGSAWLSAARSGASQVREWFRGTAAAADSGQSEGVAVK
jgi:hypothetical protein